MLSLNQHDHSLLRFLYRMIKDCNLYGELAFAETAESLRMNIEAMRIGNEDRVVGITASGDVLLSLIAAGPKAVVGFDANSAQTAIAHLKLASVLALSVEDYKRFMGLETMPGETRLQILSRISRSIPNGPRRRILKMRQLVAKGVLNHGMSHMIIELLVSSARALMSQDTHALFLGVRGTDSERAAKLQKIRNRRAFRHVLRPLLRRLAPRMKWLLFPHRFCAISHRPEEIIGDFLSVFETLLVRGMKENPILCRAALGQLHAEWSDHLYSENKFAAIRNNAPRLSLHTADFVSGLKQVADSWATRLYLSNMPDYLGDEQLMELVREVKRAAAPGARIVYYSLYDRDLLPDLGPKISAAELQALQDGDSVLIYPTVMVRTREPVP
jgi:S-adenosylmethionine:diacylglycerol 3-amino-3-carboxypropyl transferase